MVDVVWDRRTNFGKKLTGTMRAPRNCMFIVTLAEKKAKVEMAHCLNPKDLPDIVVKGHYPNVSLLDLHLSDGLFIARLWKGNVSGVGVIFRRGKKLRAELKKTHYCHE